jgi:hypothetical protein
VSGKKLTFIASFDLVWACPLCRSEWGFSLVTTLHQLSHLHAQVPITVIIPHLLDISPPTSTSHISRLLDLDAPPHRLWLTPSDGAKAVEVSLMLQESSEEGPIMVLLPSRIHSALFTIA